MSIDDMAAKKLTPEQNIAITKIVLGVVEWIIRIFGKKHGSVPSSPADFKKEFDSAKSDK